MCYVNVFETRPCSHEQDYYLKRAGIIATFSNIYHHRHGAIIVNRRTGEIISEGFNHSCSYLSNVFSFHAEIDALSKIKKYPRPQDLDLYVVRIGNGVNLKYSKPCLGCTEAIIKAGIRRVYFSTDGNRHESNNLKPTCYKSFRPQNHLHEQHKML